MLQKRLWRSIQTITAKYRVLLTLLWLTKMVTTVNLKLGYRIYFLAFAMLLLFTGCNESTKRDIYFVLDAAGVLIPREAKIDLPLEKQKTEEAFSFQDYCKEEYDTIFILYPYFNTEKDDFINLKMSDILRRKCDNNTFFDSFSTLLFINNGIVEAYSIIEITDADFESQEVEEHYIFPIDQKFIMDKKRNVHIYNEQ